MVPAQHLPSMEDVSEQASVKFNIKQDRARYDIVIMSIIMITMHRYNYDIKQNKSQYFLGNKR